LKSSNPATCFQPLFKSVARVFLIGIACSGPLPGEPAGRANLSIPPAVGGAVKASVADYRGLVIGKAALTGYWPLAGNLDAAAGGLALRSGKDKPVFRAGPLGADSSIDLSNGGYLVIAPSGDLDAPEITVEMLFRVKYSTSGTLFGIRDGSSTRFSLHFAADSPTLRFWNGAGVTSFEADSPVKMGEWHHVAMSTSAGETVVWLNGKRCRPAGATGMAVAAKGLPFLVATTDAKTGGSERAEIQVAHLAIYQSLLGDDAVVARLKALGWEDRLRPVPKVPIEDEIARIDERVARIKEDYGVDVHYKYDHKTFIPEVWHSVGEGSQLPMEYVPMVLDEIEAFLAVVPEPVSRKELDSIFMFDQLKIGGGGMGAMAYGKSIYLCCVRPPIEIRYSIYHELSHILQVAYPVLDAPWAELLPEGFAYGRNTNVNPFGFDDKLRSDGFIINYSTWNRHEDIAVMSDYIFVRKDETLDMMEAYPAIRRKVAAVVNYYKAIHPDYDMSFYDDIIRDAGAPVIYQPPADPGE
jgi:hypothetical protein